MTIITAGIISRISAIAGITSITGISTVSGVAAITNAVILIVVILIGKLHIYSLVFIYKSAKYGCPLGASKGFLRRKSSVCINTAKKTKAEAVANKIPVIYIYSI